MTEQEQGLTLQAGTLLQEFRIEKILGDGGFGITYLAFDTDLEKYVAIKEYLPIDFAIRRTDKTVIPRTESTKEDFNWGLQAFINEARILAKFDHPNIVRINRFFQLQGTAYIAMEYVQGRTLTETIKDLDKLTQVEILSLLAPLIDGLKQVHQQNYYHRDIKPDNIILRDNGSPVLIDFGAARLAIGGKSRSVSTIITEGYAPIEQYSSKGKLLGAWTDIYALAAVAYTCLTGERPDDASDRVIDDEMIPAVQAVSQQGSVAFLTAIDKGLAVRADGRPQTLEAWWVLLSQESNPKKVVLPTQIIKPDGQVKSIETIKLEQPQDDQEELAVSKARTIFKFLGILLILAVLGSLGFFAYKGYVQREQELRQEKLAKQAEIARQEKLAQMHPNMISIPAGKFRMGDLSDVGWSFEKPVHTVNIRAFKLSQTEVTFAQYDAYVEAAGVTMPDDQGWGRSNRPVINVSWDDVVAYINWLNQQTNQHFRLASESEWEYAARAGGSTKYSWGDSIEVNKANCDGCGSPWDGKQTAPVASFQANHFGLYDMQGNVWEWVQDCWQANYDNYPNNNTANYRGDCSRRVVRGGAWRFDMWSIRSASRFWILATYGDGSIGFRLAQD